MLQSSQVRPWAERPPLVLGLQGCTTAKSALVHAASHPDQTHPLFSIFQASILMSHRPLPPTCLRRWVQWALEVSCASRSAVCT